MIEINAIQRDSDDQEKQLSFNPLYEVKVNGTNVGNQTTEKEIEAGIEKKSIPKEKSEKEEKLVIDIEHSIDILAADPNPFLYFLCLGLNCLKFLTYISIIQNNTPSDDDDRPSVPSILIALVFAAVSMGVTGFPVFKHLIMMAGSAVLTHEGSFNVISYYQKAFLVITELGNFAMLYVGATFIVPAQGSPLQIVLNCTALMTVASLDEGFFRCFSFSLKKVPHFDDKKEVLEKNTKLFLVFVFIAGTVVTFFFLLLLYILYKSTKSTI